jgi:uncharacterized repeat protein (TIGR03803 family)
MTSAHRAVAIRLVVQNYRDRSRSRRELFTVLPMTVGKGYGVVYGFDLASGVETVLYDFGASPTDGMNPASGVTQDSSGNLYGTTNKGGIYGYGTVFKLTKKN